MAIVTTLLISLLVLVCILMVLIILMQRPKQEGLGAAFGGGMTDSMFGAQTTDVLQKGTTWLSIIFFCTTISLAAIKTREFDKEASKGEDLIEATEPLIDPMPQMPIDLGAPAVAPLESIGGEAEPAAAPTPAADAAPAATTTPAPAEKPKPEAKTTPAPAAKPASTPAADKPKPAPAKPAASTPATDAGAAAKPEAKPAPAKPTPAKPAPAPAAEADADAGN